MADYFFEDYEILRNAMDAIQNANNDTDIYEIVGGIHIKLNGNLVHELRICILDKLCELINNDLYYPDDLFNKMASFGFSCVLTNSMCQLPIQYFIWLLTHAGIQERGYRIYGNITIENFNYLNDNYEIYDDNE